MANLLIYDKTDNLDNIAVGTKPVTTSVSVSNNSYLIKNGNVGYPFSFDNSKIYSYVFNIKFNSASTYFRILDTQENSPWTGFLFWYKQEGLVFEAYNSNSITGTFTIPFLPNINKFYNMCLVVDNSLDGKIKLYIDYVLVKEFTNTKKINSYTSKYIRFNRTTNTCDFNLNRLLVFEEEVKPSDTIPSIDANIDNSNNLKVSVTYFSVINKVEVLVNDAVSETYSDNYNNINYLIDESLCVIGNNDITIRVTYDDTYTEELLLTHKVTIDKLPLQTPLLDTVERVKLLIESKQNEKSILSKILTSKNVEVSEQDKMSDLIGKVDLLGEYDNPILYLYKDGDFNDKYNKSNFDKEGQVINYNLDHFEIANKLPCSVNQLCIESIDFTNYKKIYIEYETTVDSNYSANYTININKAKLEETNGSVSSFRGTSSFLKGIKSLDVSNVIGIYHLNLTVYYASFKVYKIWLEK